ncbi:zinc finger (C3HC4-type RING finger) family protein [Striga hermonthica]|uniref:RING-type E3 ubiquitin transferase n=1 Tax=Striga hermonthica TaxID=68872 RepID=A0A9N7N7E1_STRHE|nr:zinc finger (C3HC4-type RING finger) family protein [Striga hermonthica]
MAIREGSNKSPEKPSKRQAEANENGHLFSPRFRSVAAMAGWDEESLLIASLIVEDTPDRQIRHKKRSDLHGFKTPPSNSRRKRKAQRRSPASIPITVLDLEENESKSKQESEKFDKKTNVNEDVVVEKNRDSDQMNTKGNEVSISGLGIECLDRLREELSCAICLEICYEPSTTPCGHSFCKKCLHSAADRCGKKCPKCRQLISNSRYSTVNTVLWNTIQLLFPKEVEARKGNDPSTSDNNEIQRETQSRNRSLHTRNRTVRALSSSPESENRRNHSFRHRSSRPSGGTSSRQQHGFSTRRALPSQDEDAALALRLQREEFMEVFRAPDEPGRDPSLAVARANLRAMASRAVNIRIRGRRE